METSSVFYTSTSFASFYLQGVDELANNFTNLLLIKNDINQSNPSLIPRQQTTIRPVGFLHPDIQWTIKRILDFSVIPAIQTIGIITNIVNIFVFAKTGLEDSITIAFFGMAFSDLGYLLCYLTMRIIGFLYTIKGMYDTAVNLNTLSFLVIWYTYILYDISVFITIYASIQKCACVAIPLLFKNVFTRARSVVIIILIYLIVLASYIPLLTTMGLKTTFNRTYNRTWLSFAFKPEIFLYQDIWLLLNRTVIPFLSEGLILISMFVMTIKLRQAARLRHRMTNEMDKKEANQNGNTLSVKELRAIKAVQLVSAIFIICNTPEIITMICTYIFPEFNDNAVYEKTYKMLSSFQDVLATSNAAINILVYYNFNTKYHNKLRELLWCFSNQQEKEK